MVIHLASTYMPVISDRPLLLWRKSTVRARVWRDLAVTSKDSPSLKNPAWPGLDLVIQGQMTRRPQHVLSNAYLLLSEDLSRIVSRTCNCCRYAAPYPSPPFTPHPLSSLFLSVFVMLFFLLSLRRLSTLSIKAPVLNFHITPQCVRARARARVCVSVVFCFVTVSVCQP